jgi:pilus assembly protein Flp/PilA
MTRFLNRFVQDESGVTAMEYGMIAALIAVVILTALGAIGTNLNTTFTTIKNAIVTANGSGSSN